MADFDNDGLNDRWPLFYDNYFVPRGYAYVLGQMNGTGYTENGCPMHGGPGDIAGEKSIIDWLNGRVKGYKVKLNATTNRWTTPDPTAEVVAGWHNGSSAMIGKSYDGTLANGVAATGVEGLKTIVPVSAISAWYNYSRTGGVRHNTNYPGGNLNPQITVDGTSQPAGPAEPPPDLRSRSTTTSTTTPNVDSGDGDAHGDINTFWRDRDHDKDASKVKAAVFVTHGIQDDNVRMDHMGMWWEALKANNVPRKTVAAARRPRGSVRVRREAEWVTTLHRWFDHYLFGVNNGIQNEPKVTIEDEVDTWGDYGDWPIPGTQNVDLFLRAGTTGGRARSPAWPAAASPTREPFTTTSTAENTLMNPTRLAGQQARVSMTPPLTKDVRLSGTRDRGPRGAFGSVHDDAVEPGVTIAD